MKRFLVTILVLLFTFQTANCQVIEPYPNNSPPDFYDYYMLKREKNHTAAWICLGGGVSAILLSQFIFVEGLVELNGDEMANGVGIFLLGGVATVASIPLFIIAGSNKPKARLSFSTTQNTVGNIRFDNTKSIGISVVVPFL